MRKTKNFRNGEIPYVQKEYEGQCFAFDQPDGILPNRIFPDDDTPRTFIGCNLVNAVPPAGSTLVMCNTSIIKRGLSVLGDEIIIDGVSIQEENYEDEILGRTNPDTLKPEYKEIPIRVPH